VRRWFLLFATVAVLVLPTEAAAKSSCRSEVGRGAEVVEQSRKVAVYQRREQPPHETVYRVYYGCDRDTATLRRLIAFSDFNYRVHHLALAGHVVAFAYSYPEGAGHETVHNIRFHDLRTDRHRTFDALSTSERKAGRSKYVRSLVLTPKGSVAWIAAFRKDEGVLDETYQVNAVETGPGGRRTKLDQGTAIGPHSLALSVGRTLYWKHGDATRSARLR
jgi:hypothetical protein